MYKNFVQNRYKQKKSAKKETVSALLTYFNPGTLGLCGLVINFYIACSS